jgi:hypothetical protein
MPGPEIIEGEGVVFAFVDTCPKQNEIAFPETGIGDRRELRGPYCRCEYPD